MSVVLDLARPELGVAGLGRRPSFWSRALHNSTFMAGVVITGVIVALVVLAPLIGRYGPTAEDFSHTLSGPSTLHWLGTDELGRDTWSRLLYGGRTDLQVGVLAVVFPFCFGVFIGTVCGYFGGWLDTVVMRVVEVVLAFPFYVLIIAIIFVVGLGTHGIYIAFGLTDWVVYARTTRSTTMVVRRLDWVAAAEGAGLSKARVLWRHILPEYHHPGDRLCDVGHRHRDPRRRNPRLPRPRHPATCPRLGRHDLRRPELHHERRPVARRLPGHRGPPHRRRPLAARRRACRPFEAGMTPLLEVQELTVEMRRHGTPFLAVRGVSFSLESGEALAVVGESGSGKSLTLRAIMGLLPGRGRIVSGRVIVDGTELAPVSAGAGAPTPSACRSSSRIP